MRIPTRLSAALCILLFSLAVARGQLIDFETTPAGGVPIDDSFLSTSYNLTLGGTVAFYFDANNSFTFDSASERAVLEAAGTDGNDGFSNNLLSMSDTANGGLAGQL